MARNTKGKRGTGGKIIVFLILLLMLAALLFWKVYTSGSWSEIKQDVLHTDENPPEETVKIVYHTPSPSPEANEQLASDAGDPEPPQQTATALQNQGSVEIFIPEGMGSDGF